MKPRRSAAAAAALGGFGFGSSWIQCRDPHRRRHRNVAAERVAEVLAAEVLAAESTHIPQSKHRPRTVCPRPGLSSGTETSSFTEPVYMKLQHRGY